MNIIIDSSRRVNSTKVTNVRSVLWMIGAALLVHYCNSIYLFEKLTAGAFTQSVHLPSVPPSYISVIPVLTEHTLEFLFLTLYEQKKRLCNVSNLFWDDFLLVNHQTVYRAESMCLSTGFRDTSHMLALQLAPTTQKLGFSLLTVWYTTTPI